MVICDCCKKILKIPNQRLTTLKKEYQTKNVLEVCDSCLNKIDRKCIEINERLMKKVMKEQQDDIKRFIFIITSDKEPVYIFKDTK